MFAKLDGLLKILVLFKTLSTVVSFKVGPQIHLPIILPYIYVPSVHRTSIYQISFLHLSTVNRSIKHCSNVNLSTKHLSACISYNTSIYWTPSIHCSPIYHLSIVHLSTIYPLFTYLSSIHCSPIYHLSIVHLSIIYSLCTYLPSIHCSPIYHLSTCHLYTVSAVNLFTLHLPEITYFHPPSYFSFEVHQLGLSSPFLG